MTSCTHTRVQRGYFRDYYAENRDELRPYHRENKRCRYRRGWAKWLLHELTAYWYAEARGVSPQSLSSMLDSQPTCDQWMSFACVGRGKRSIGRSAEQIRSTG